MVGADLLCAMLLLTVPLAARYDALTGWHLLMVAVGLGCGFCWFDAAAWGAIVQLVGRERLPAANSLTWSTSTVVGVVVPAGAGAFLVAVDPATLLGLDAISYLLSAVLIAGLGRRLSNPPSDGTAGVRVGDIRAGVRFIWRHPVIRALTGAGFGLSVAAGGVLGLLVVHADEVMRIDPGDPRIGLLYTACAVGALAAAVILPWLSRRYPVGVISGVGFGLVVAAGIGLLLVRQTVAALCLWAVWDGARTLAIINSITVRQRLTPDELQGRVNTTARMVAWGGTPFGALLGGVLASTAGLRAAYVTLAVVAAVAGLVVFSGPVRRLRIR